MEAASLLMSRRRTLRDFHSVRKNQTPLVYRYRSQNISSDFNRTDTPAFMHGEECASLFFNER
jgi:hypothetical protein